MKYSENNNHINIDSANGCISNDSLVDDAIKNRKCIYCGKELDGSSEHVLQESLGAKWHNEYILCAECNNLFGNTVDYRLKNDFDIFLNWLGIKSKKGKYTDITWLTKANTSVVQSGKNGHFIFPLEKKQLHCQNGCLRLTLKTSNLRDITNTISKLSKQPSFNKVEIKNIHTTYESLDGSFKNIDISVDSSIALRKSLTNMWLCTTDKIFLDKSIDAKQYSIEMELITKEAMKIRKCFGALKKGSNNNNTSLETIYNKVMEQGFFDDLFVAHWVGRSKINIKRVLRKKGLNLFHYMMIFKVSSCLWGIITLFNNITFLFKLSENSVLPEGCFSAFFNLKNYSHFFHSFNSTELSINDLNMVPFKDYRPFNRSIVESEKKSLLDCLVHSNKQFDFDDSFIAFIFNLFDYLNKITEINTIKKIKINTVEEIFLIKLKNGSLEQRKDFIHNDVFIKSLAEAIVNETMYPYVFLDKKLYCLFVNCCLSTIDELLGSPLSLQINEEFVSYLNKNK